VEEVQVLLSNVEMIKFKKVEVKSVTMEILAMETDVQVAVSSKMDQYLARKRK